MDFLWSFFRILSFLCTFVADKEKNTLIYQP